LFAFRILSRTTTMSRTGMPRDADDEVEVGIDRFPDRVRRAGGRT